MIQKSMQDLPRVQGARLRAGRAEPDAALAVRLIVQATVEVAVWKPVRLPARAVAGIAVPAVALAARELAVAAAAVVAAVHVAVHAAAVRVAAELVHRAVDAAAAVIHVSGHATGRVPVATAAAVAPAATVRARLVVTADAV